MLVLGVGGEVGLGSRVSVIIGLIVIWGFCDTIMMSRPRRVHNKDA